MNSAEQEAFEQLKQSAGKSDAQHQLSGWVVRTGRQGVYYLHEYSSLSFQTLGAARVAVHALGQNGHSDIIGTGLEDEERSEIHSLCCCLDGVIGQLHKQVKSLKAYQRQPQGTVEASWGVQSKIVHMYDICAYVDVDKASLTLTQEDTLLQRSTKLRCQLLLATCAVFAQKLLHRSSYTSGYRQHCMYTLLQELKQTGAQSPALAMLVEPLLPRTWRKELDQQKILKDDVDTDLYAISIGEQDVAQGCEEEGSPLQDDFIVHEGPKMAKLALKVQEIIDALDLVPVCKKDCVDKAVAHAMSQGLDKLMQCFRALESKYADSKFHQAWLRAFKQAISGDGSAEQQLEQNLLPCNLPKNLLGQAEAHA
ncbi:TPA: hypothetical protein ACH3X2_000744 [Trebouxia sp. C0005]